jgi:hypothetical protein
LAAASSSDRWPALWLNRMHAWRILMTCAVQSSGRSQNQFDSLSLGFSRTLWAWTHSTSKERLVRQCQSA